MPTTDGALGAVLLNALACTEVPFAVLHDETRVAAGSVTSDVDIASGCSAFDTVRALVEPAAAAGLVPVLVWPYDVASASTFWATRDARDGVQLDVTGDPRGLGRYGFRTDTMLDRARPGMRWPVLNELDQALYLLRKHQMKSEAATTSDTRRDITARFGETAAKARAESLFSPPAARSVRDLLSIGVNERNRGLAPHLARSTRRAGWRIRHPVGFWVELAGEADRWAPAEEIAGRFRGFLVDSVSWSGNGHGLRDRLGLWSELARRRWRPQLVVTSIADAPTPDWPRPDLRIHDTDHDLDTLSRTIVTAMRERTISLIGPTVT